jgi:hypothetical protein
MPNRIINIDKNNLPISSDTGEYIFRYRIVSDDKNRFSAWSPQYRLQAPTISQIMAANNVASLPIPSYSVQTASGGEKVATVSWNIPAIFSSVEKYDVYIKWGSSTGTNAWEFFKTVSAGTFVIVKPSTQTNNTINIKIQSVVYPKKVLESQVLYTLTDKAFS